MIQQPVLGRWLLHASAVATTYFAPARDTRERVLVVSLAGAF